MVMVCKAAKKMKRVQKEKQTNTGKLKIPETNLKFQEVIGSSLIEIETE